MINFTKRQRSELWFKINNDNSIVTSYKCKEVLSHNLKLDSKIWFKTHSDNYLLSFNDISNRLKEIELFLNYMNQFIWLGLNNSIKKYFDNNNILDYCVARDLNFLIDCNIDVLIEQYQSSFICNKKTLVENVNYLKKIKDLTNDELIKCNYKGKNNLLRTLLGYTEFMLKYRRCDINNIDSFYDILLNGLIDCLEILPLDTENIYFTTIPINIDENENNKLSYKLVKRLSYILNNNLFILKCHKPSFKDKTLNEKISIWNEIYSDTSKFEFTEKVDITYKDVIIIDDLYQSGVSMWSYAKFLKSLGAKRVMGISAVKSLRDSDNTNV